MERFDPEVLLQNIRDEWAGQPPGSEQPISDLVRRIAELVATAAYISETRRDYGDLSIARTWIEFHRAAFEFRASHLGMWTLPPVALTPLRNHKAEPRHAGVSKQSFTEVAASLRDELLDEIQVAGLASGEEEREDLEPWLKRLSDWYRTGSRWELAERDPPVIHSPSSSEIAEADAGYVQIDRAFEPLKVGANLEFDAVRSANPGNRLEFERLRFRLNEMIGGMMAMHEMFVSSHVGHRTGGEEKTFRSNRQRLVESVRGFDEAFPEVRPFFRSHSGAPVTTFGRVTERFAEAVRLHAFNHFQAKDIATMGTTFAKIFPEYSIWSPSAHQVSPDAYLGLSVDRETGDIRREGYKVTISFRPDTDDMRMFLIAFDARGNCVTDDELRKVYRSTWEHRYKLKSGVNRELRKLGVEIVGSPMALKKTIALPER